jgi:DNA-binding NtrC family response regulator
VITREAIDQLEKHRWPGNVRELENALARAVIMAGSGPIRPEHLPGVQLAADSTESVSVEEAMPPSRRAGERSLKEVERQHIAWVLREQGGNIKAAAGVLGVSRTTLYKKLKDYGIDGK